MSDFIEFSLYGGKANGKFYPGSHRYFVNGKPRTGVTTYIGIVDKSRPLITWATELYRDYLLGMLETNIVISENVVYEGCSLHEERKQEAAAIGDEVHKWIERYVKGETPAMPETREAQIGVTAFLDWQAANNVKFLSSERVVYSEKHGYIGTLDIEAEVDRKLCLIDIKTSNGIYNTYGLQTAAYVRADEEETGKKYHGRWIIRLSKETEAEYVERMAKKNANRERKGQSTFEPAPYQVFESKFLDEQPDALNRDFAAFLNAKALYEWNKETDTFRKAA
jgi:hypothetical protein